MVALNSPISDNRPFEGNAGQNIRIYFKESFSGTRKDFVSLDMKFEGIFDPALPSSAEYRKQIEKQRLELAKQTEHL